MATSGSIQVSVTQVGLEQSIVEAVNRAIAVAKANVNSSNIGGGRSSGGGGNYGSGGARSISSLSQPLGRITGQADQFTKSMEAANARVIAFGASVGIISAVNRAFKSMVESNRQVEKSLTDIATVAEMTKGQLDSFGKKLFEVAANTGQSFKDVSEGALELARQGLSATESLKRINDAMILSRLSGLGAAESVEGMTAAVNSFASAGLTTAQILNKMVLVAQKYSVSEADLIEGVKRSASVAELAGVSFDELSALITVVQEKTARGGAVIGNAFKTIFARIQDETVLSSLQSLGVVVTDTSARVLPATRIMENLADAFKDMNTVSQAAIAKQLGGVYQLDKLLAAVGEMDTKKGKSKFRTIEEQSQGATSEAYTKNAMLGKTLDAAFKSAEVSATRLGDAIGNIASNEALKTLITWGAEVMDKMSDLAKGTGTWGEEFKVVIRMLSGAMVPVLAVIGAAMVKVITGMAKFATSSVSSLLQFNSKAKEMQALQMAINSELMSNKSLQERMLALDKDRVAQTKLLIQELTMAKGIGMEMMATAKGGTQALYNMGARSGGRGGIDIAPDLPRKGRAASGYIPEMTDEALDIKKGVGGALPSDKPVLIKGFKFGNGRTGDMVANSGEVLVKNYKGTGASAILNRDMVRKYGLPEGAVKISYNGGGASVPRSAFGKIPAADRQYLAGMEGMNNIQALITAEQQKVEAINKANKALTDFMSSLTKSEQTLKDEINARQQDIKDIKADKQSYKNRNPRYGMTDKAKTAIAALDGDINVAKGKLQTINNAKSAHSSAVKSAEDRYNTQEQLIGKYTKDKKGGDMNIGESKKIVSNISMSALGLSMVFNGLANATSDAKKDIDFLVNHLAEFGTKISSATLAFSTFSDIASSGGKFGKVVGNLGMVGSVAYGVFEAFKLGHQVMQDLSGATAAAAKGMAKFSDAVEKGGVSIDSVGRSMRLDLVEDMRKAMADSGFGNFNSNPIIKAASKDDELVKSIAQARLNIGGSSKETLDKIKNIAFEKNKNNQDLKYSYDNRQRLQARGHIAPASPISMKDFYATNLMTAEDIKAALGEIAPDVEIAAKVRTQAAMKDAKDRANAKLADYVPAASLKVEQARLDNIIKYKAEIIASMSVMEGSLQIEKDLLDTTDARKASIEQESIRLKSNRDLVKEQVEAAANFLKDQEALKLKLEAVGDVVPVEQFQMISNITKDLTDEIIKQGGYNSTAKGLLNDQLKSIGLTAEQQSVISDLLNDQLDQLATNNKLALVNETAEKRRLAISEAINLSIKNTNSARQEELSLQQSSLDFLSKVLTAQDRIYKSRVDLVKPFMSKGDQLRMSVANASRERGSAIAKSEIEKMSSIRDLKKDLLSTIVDQKLGADLINKVNGAKTIDEFDAIGKEIESAQKNAAKEALSNAFNQAKIQINAADYFHKTVVESADTLTRVFDGMNDLVNKVLVDGGIGVPMQRLSIKPDPTLNKPKEILDDLDAKYAEAMKALEASPPDGTTRTRIEQARNSIIGVSADLAATLEEITNNVDDWSLKLEVQFDKLMLKFISDMAAKTRENIALSGQIDRLGIYKSRDLEDPSSFDRITDPQEYLKKQQEIESKYFDQVQKLEMEKMTREAEIQFKNEQMNLENMKQLSLNTKALQDLRDQLIDGAGLSTELPDDVKKQAARSLGNLGSDDQLFLRKLIGAEVGGDSIESKATFLGTIFNRSQAYGQSFSSVMRNGKYYEPIKNGSISKATPISEEELNQLLSHPSINHKFLHNATDNSAGHGLMKEASIQAKVGKEMYYTKSFEMNKIKGLWDDMSLDKVNELWRATEELSKLEGDLSQAAIDAAKKIMGSGSSDESVTEQAKRMIEAAESLKNNTATQEQAKKTNITQQKVAKELLNKGDFMQGLDAAFRQINEERAKFKFTLGSEVPKMFSDNMTDAIMNMIDGAESFGEILRGAAYNFVKTLNQKLVGNMVDGLMDSFVGTGSNSVLSGLFSGNQNILKRASGGKINGGSGVKDDVPAMLMGGEYVINKKAVSKYGDKFLQAINEGSLGGFASGGKVQKGGYGSFYTPSLYGLGGISGKKNLLTFASQGFTTGAYDSMVNTATSAGIAIEPESVRLTNFARKNSEASKRTRQAKESAFNLYIEQLQAEAQAKKDSKLRNKQLMNQVGMAVGSLALSPLFKAGSIGFGNAYSNNRSIMSGIGGIFNGLNKGGSNYGGINTLFSGQFENAFKKVRRATGGSIPESSGIDTVPAVLSGGEFVLNRSAAKRLGQDKLNSLNSGASSGISDEVANRIIEKLDELVQKSEGGTSITINVSDSGKSTQEVKGNSAQEKQQLARQIRDTVVSVIDEQKRLGGKIRR